MPRVTVGNKEIVVNFQHGTLPCNHRGKTPRPDSEYTQCVILSGDVGCRDEQKTVVADVTVRRYYKDKANRKLARMTAIDMAVSKGDFTREERAAIWSTINRKLKVCTNTKS